MLACKFAKIRLNLSKVNIRDFGKHFFLLQIFSFLTTKQEEKLNEEKISFHPEAAQRNKKKMKDRCTNFENRR